jgi:nucleotide-binding universal stress UspA family protein
MKKIQRVLVAIDDEPESRKVASAALQLVEQLHTEVALVSVVEQSVIMMNNDIMGMGGIGINENANAELQIEKSWKKNFEDKHKDLIDNMYVNHAVDSFIVEGVPEEEVLAIATKWKADLIVVGTHGRTGIDHFLIGSISEKIIRHSSIPVLVVPTKQL